MMWFLGAQTTLRCFWNLFVGLYYNNVIDCTNRIQSSSDICLSVLTSFGPRPTTLSQERRFVPAVLKMSSNRWTPMIRSARSTTLLKFRSEAALKKLSNLSLSLNLRRGPWRSELDWWAGIKALDDIYTNDQQTAISTGNCEDPCWLLRDP